MKRAENDEFEVTDILDGSSHKDPLKPSCLAISKVNMVQGLRIQDNVFSDAWCDRAYIYSTKDIPPLDGKLTKIFKNR